MNQKLVLGTYTKRESKGIYSIELDKNDKKLKNLKEEIQVNNPTYLAGNADYSLMISIAKSPQGLGGIKS